jgi:hypothetical protein
MRRGCFDAGGLICSNRVTGCATVRASSREAVTRLSGSGAGVAIRPRKMQLRRGQTAMDEVMTGYQLVAMTDSL